MDLFAIINKMSMSKHIFKNVVALFIDPYIMVYAQSVPYGSQTEASHWLNKRVVRADECILNVH